MKQKLETLFSAVITLAIAVMAVTFVHGQWSPPAAAARAVAAPRFIKSWRSMLADGTTIGDPNAPVKLIEFSDLECPYCKQFHDVTYPAVKRVLGDSIALVFIHFPIQSHRFERSAARAAECARAQGRFTEMVDQVYASQDSLGLKSWHEFARAATVPDLNEFDRCNANSAPVERLERGAALGSSIGVHATPTVLVNGWLLDGAPQDTGLVRAARRILAGRDP